MTTLYRKGVFVVKGLQEFTTGGYHKASQKFCKTDLDVNLSGRVVIVTGANSGIGKSASVSLASKGAEIHMVCRSEERANAARADIIKESKNENIHVHIVDMSNTADVIKFAQKFKEENPQLNVLVNNAGCMVHEVKHLGPLKLETNFATNTVGTYCLTEELIPLLQKSDKPRVITVSSGGMYLQRLTPTPLIQVLEPFDGEQSYAQQKRQQVVLTDEWGKQHSSIHFSSMHPGWADTPAVRNAMPDFHRQMAGKLRTEPEGADTIVWLAASDAALKTKTGQFFLDRQPQRQHLPLAWTPESASERKKFIAAMEDIRSKIKASMES